MRVQQKINNIGNKYITKHKLGIVYNAHTNQSTALKMSEYKPFTADDTPEKHRKFLAKRFLELKKFKGELATAIQALCKSDLNGEITQLELVRAISLEVIRKLGMDYLSKHSKSSHFHSHQNAALKLKNYCFNIYTQKTNRNPSYMEMWFFLGEIYSEISLGSLSTSIYRLFKNSFQCDLPSKTYQECSGFSSYTAYFPPELTFRLMKEMIASNFEEFIITFEPDVDSDTFALALEAQQIINNVITNPSPIPDYDSEYASTSLEIRRNQRLAFIISKLVKAKNYDALDKIFESGFVNNFNRSFFTGSETPVQLLASENDTVAVDFLIDHYGLSVDQAVIGYACRGDDVNVATMLIKRKATVGAAVLGYARGGHVSQVEAYLQKYPTFKEKALEGYALAGDKVHVEALLAQGESMDAAIRGYSKGGYRDQAEDLILSGGNISFSVHGYAEVGDSENVEAMLARGASLDFAIQGYALSGYVDKVDNLLLRGADKDWATRGYALSGLIGQSESLLAHGANLDMAVSGVLLSDFLVDTTQSLRTLAFISNINLRKRIAEEHKEFAAVSFDIKELLPRAIHINRLIRTENLNYKTAELIPISSVKRSNKKFFAYIYQLAKTKDLRRLNKILSSGKTVNIWEKFETPLEKLAFEGKHEAVEFLIAHSDANINHALKGYARGAHVNHVEALLARGAIINAAVFGYALAGNVVNVENMFLRKANINNAVIAYARVGNSAEVEALLLRGADRNLALAGYACGAHENQVEDLLARGADIDKAAFGYAQARNTHRVEVMILRGASIDIIVDGYAQGGHVEKVEEFLLRGADINSTVKGYAQAGDATMVESLLMRGANANVALLGYARSSHTNKVEDLLIRGLDTDYAVFGYAISLDINKVEEMLLRGASLNLAVRGYAIAGNAERVEDLLVRGANISKAMVGYAGAGYTDRVEDLLARGASLDDAVKAYAGSARAMNVEDLLRRKASIIIAVKDYADSGFFTTEHQALRTLASISDEDLRELVGKELKQNHQEAIHYDIEAVLSKAANINNLMRKHLLSFDEVQAGKIPALMRTKIISATQARAWLMPEIKILILQGIVHFSKVASYSQNHSVDPKIFLLIVSFLVQAKYEKLNWNAKDFTQEVYSVPLKEQEALSLANKLIFHSYQNRFYQSFFNKKRLLTVFDSVDLKIERKQHEIPSSDKPSEAIINTNKTVFNTHKKKFLQRFFYDLAIHNSLLSVNDSVVINDTKRKI